MTRKLQQKHEESSCLCQSVHHFTIRKIKFKWKTYKVYAWQKQGCTTTTTQATRNLQHKFGEVKNKAI